MSIGRNTDIIQQVLERLQQPDLRLVVRENLVSEALRISIVYQDAHAPTSIATLRRGHPKICELQVIYDRQPQPALLKYPLPSERYTALLIGLRRAKFDTLDDAEELSLLSQDLWMIERAAGSFYHSVLLSPTQMRGHHRELVLTVREHLPEGIREGA